MMKMKMTGTNVRPGQPLAVIVGAAACPWRSLAGSETFIAFSSVISIPSSSSGA